MKTTIQVRNLQAGDDLGNCVVVSKPYNLGTYHGQKNRAKVVVKFLDGTESVRVWGMNTTVTITNR